MVIRHLSFRRVYDRLQVQHRSQTFEVHTIGVANVFLFRKYNSLRNAFAFLFQIESQISKVITQRLCQKRERIVGVAHTFNLTV